MNTQALTDEPFASGENDTRKDDAKEAIYWEDCNLIAQTLSKTVGKSTFPISPAQIDGWIQGSGTIEEGIIVEEYVCCFLGEDVYNGAVDQDNLLDLLMTKCFETLT